MMSLLLVALAAATAGIAWAIWERRQRRDVRKRLESEVEAVRQEATTRIRRLEAELEEARATGHLDFAEDLMDAVDTLERAREEMPDDEGVEMVERSIVQSFRRFGLEPIEPRNGEAFDPERHEAWSTRDVPADAHRDVCQVHRRGWSFEDRVLRPAAVTVGMHEEVVLEDPADSDADVDDEQEEQAVRQETSKE